MVSAPLKREETWTELFKEFVDLNIVKSNVHLNLKKLTNLSFYNYILDRTK